MCEVEGIDPYQPHKQPSVEIIDQAWRYHLRVILYDKLYKRMEQFSFDVGMRPYWRLEPGQNRAVS